MAGVPDDDRVDVTRASCEELRFRGSESKRAPRPRRPALPEIVPDSDVLLVHVDADSAQTRDHLRVARIRALVRSEVAEFQDRTSSTTRSARSRSGERSSCWLVIISLIRPREKNCIPITTSRTPSISSGLCPIALPSAFSTVR